LILIPILLDSLFWLGPRISVQDLAQEAVRTFETELPALPSEELTELFGVVSEALNQAAVEYNTLTGLRVGMLGIPSLLIWGGAQLGSPSAYEGLWVSFLRTFDMSDLLVSVPRASFGLPAVWQIHSQGTWLLTVIGLSLAGTAIGSVYLTLAWGAQTAEPDPERPPFWARVGRLSVRFVLFWLLRTLVLAMLSIPFVLALALVAMLSPELALLFASIALGLGTWLSFYGTFILAAMVVNDAPVLRAIWNSVGVVLRNFWPTLWLFILINLIGGGLTILWQQVGHGAWTGLAIAGNAYIGTSLIVASLLFYQDRYVRWQEALAELMAQQEKQAT
jgi:hypothetical protein